MPGPFPALVSAPPIISMPPITASVIGTMLVGSASVWRAQRAAAAPCDCVAKWLHPSLTRGTAVWSMGCPAKSWRTLPASGRRSVGGGPGSEVVDRFSHWSGIADPSHPICPGTLLVMIRHASAVRNCPRSGAPIFCPCARLFRARAWPLRAQPSRLSPKFPNKAKISQQGQNFPTRPKFPNKVCEDVGYVPE